MRGIIVTACALLIIGGAQGRDGGSGNAPGTPTPTQPILVVGSLNADVIIEVDRLPRSGETLVSRDPNTGRVVPGGKGCNQAVAAARLGASGARFVCQFGDDAHAAMLERALIDAGVDLSACQRCEGVPSGQGYVLLEPDGTVSSVVVGGSNAAWPPMDPSACAELVRGASCVLLQREVPERVNEALASAARAAGVPVVQDVGGEDRPLSDAHLTNCDVLAPNESELQRLSGAPARTRDEVIAAARALQARGARCVLVTLGAAGSLLLTAAGEVLEQPAAPVPGGKVVDATGAGDCYRVAFATALVEGRPWRECMQFGAAAGALAVSRLGAVPSIPARAEVDALRKSAFGGAGARGGAHAPADAPAAALRGGSSGAAADGPSAVQAAPILAECPLEFGSRLNSMKDRPELWSGEGGVLGWVARQGTARGLGLVDFNYPQHLDGLSHEQVRDALSKAGLRAGAVCLRFPKSMQLGAYTHPDKAVRDRAIQLTIEAGEWARALGAKEVVVWSAYDGYDYSLQVDHTVLWDREIDAYRRVCDALPDIKVSLEYKPTDENTRFFAVPSTGAALLLALQVQRPNMGLTLDVGHCLAAGENPAQSVALVGRAGKLFGIQLNDGYTRLGAEDGLMFGSVHPLMALELVYWLQEVGFDGHCYFDTFPRNEDPVREAEYNVRRFKQLWAKALALRSAGIAERMRTHDALGALEMLERMDGSEAPSDGSTGGSGPGR